MLNLETLTWVYGISLFVVAMGLFSAQKAGYFRWQNTVEKNGWPSVAALLFTLLVPFIVAIIKISN